MDKIKDEVAQVVKERIKHPVIGAFIVSATIINWKLLLIIFSSVSINEKFTLAVQHDNLTNLLLYPLAFSILIALVNPILQYSLAIIQDKLEYFRKKSDLSNIHKFEIEKAYHLMETDTRIREIESNHY